MNVGVFLALAALIFVMPIGVIGSLLGSQLGRVWIAVSKTRTERQIYALREHLQHDDSMWVLLRRPMMILAFSLRVVPLGLSLAALGDPPMIFPLAPGYVRVSDFPDKGS